VRTLFILAGVVIVAVIVIAFYREGVPRSGEVALGPAMLAGAPAASFTVKRLNGKDDSLAGYRGKVVLVNLWATWCTPCRAEMPALEQLYREDRSKGFIVLGIDQGESAKVAAEYARARGVSFPVLIDEAQQYGRAYAARGIPTSVLVDRNGHVVKGVDGEMTLAQMRALITPVLTAK